MSGRISRLVDNRQVGSITADDGQEYVFRASSLKGMTFAQLSLGTAVSFSPALAGTELRAELVSAKDGR